MTNFSQDKLCGLYIAHKDRSSNSECRRWLNGLSEAVANKVFFAGFRDKQELIEAFDLGLIRAGSIKQLGKKGIGELRKWLSIPCHSASAERNAIKFLVSIGYKVTKE